MSRTLYFADLESLRRDLIDMGETTMMLFDEAVLALTEPSTKPTLRAGELEAKTDDQHRMIHDRCLNLITLQAPVARDACLITGILDAIVDLELIGDYCYEMVTLLASRRDRMPSQIAVRVREVAGGVRGVLEAAIDCWRRGALKSSGSRGAPAIKADCGALYEMVSRSIAGPGDSMVYVDTMMVCRNLERILRHTLCVADLAPNAPPTEVARAH
jgi:phosphate transport system protein